jgi:hypothetical protein
MNDTTDAPAAPESISPLKSHDGRTMIGHVVVSNACAGYVAVWHVDTAGNNTGAWIFRLDLARPDPAIAKQVLDLCLQRSVVAWDPAEPIALLERLAEAANVPVLSYADTAVALPEAVDLVVTTRSAYEKHTRDVRLHRDVVDIQWPVGLPVLMPSTFDGMWHAVGLALPPTEPAAEHALMTCAVLRWTVRRWQETMTALSRRRHLQEEFGRPHTLPPVWESRLADAFERQRAW